MKGSKTLNMTVGSPIRLLIQFSIPLLIGNLFQQVYGLTDSMIVGQFLGANAIASIGATNSVTFLFFSVCNGISSGAGIVTAQFFGGGLENKTKSSIANSAYIMLAAAIVMGTSAFLAAPNLLQMLGTPAEILPDSLIYIRVNCIGVMLVAVYNYSAEMLRALGDSRTPLYFLICACLLNVVLDLLFVCVFDMGVFGAAFATVLAQMTAGIGCLIYAFKYNSYFNLTKKDLRVDFSVIFQALRIGLPLALQWSMIALSITALQRFVNSFGASAMAAYTVTNRIEQLVQMPYKSISSALSTYAGQNYGAKNLARVKNGLRHGMLLAVILSASMLLVFQLLKEPIMGLFVKEQDVIEIGAKGLSVTSCFYLTLGGIYVSRGILNGVGDAMFAFINGIVEIGCRFLIPYILVALFPGVDQTAIWWTSGLTWTIGALFCLTRYFFWNRKTNRLGLDVKQST